MERCGGTKVVHDEALIRSTARPEHGLEQHLPLAHVVQQRHGRDRAIVHPRVALRLLRTIGRSVLKREAEEGDGTVLLPRANPLSDGAAAERRDRGRPPHFAANPGSHALPTGRLHG